MPEKSKLERILELHQFAELAKNTTILNETGKKDLQEYYLLRQQINEALEFARINNDFKEYQDWLHDIDKLRLDVARLIKVRAHLEKFSTYDGIVKWLAELRKIAGVQA